MPIATEIAQVDNQLYSATPAVVEGTLDKAKGFNKCPLCSTGSPFRCGSALCASTEDMEAQKQHRQAVTAWSKQAPAIEPAAT